MRYELPDKTYIELWQDTTDYKKIYYVDGSNSNADDNNSGTKESPFKTISAAAKIAKAGEKVIIKGGIYRECVRPEGYGKDADNMLCFEGAEGEEVIITGGEIFEGEWTESFGWKRTDPYVRKEDIDEKVKVYMAKLPRNAFDGVNPFSVVNGPAYPWYGYKSPIFWAKENEQYGIVVQKTGMIFCNGERIPQVSAYYELYDKECGFYVEGDGLTVHIRLKNDENPNKHILEFTARSQCFCPENPFTGYIHIKNLTFTKAGNAFPPPQSGAVSSNCGHHFIIEGCTVEDANSIGIDIGHQCPARFSDSEKGFSQVYNCVIRDCGVCGICGTCGGSSEYHYIDQQQEGVYVCNNKLYNCAYHNFAQLWENAAIKLHHMKNSVIAGNYINGVPHGMGIWADASNSNILITENAVLHTCNEYGSIMLEATLDECHISHNIVIDSKQDYVCKTERGGSGIYSHCCDETKNYKNIVLNCQYGGIRMLILSPERESHNKRGGTGFGMEYQHNIISDCEAAILQTNERGFSDNNIFGSFSGIGALRIQEPPMFLNLEAWRKWMGWDKNGRMADISYSLNEDETVLSMEIDKKKVYIDMTKDIVAQTEDALKTVR